ncbi:acyltransferase [Flavobacterium caseinilyticum]|uniref:Acyltransferase n=1 Tax=Flavobacterium caseinilyticum TaxID=2541732 RepID=A0A4R5AVA4_9FLAO|nr:acyltransferase [Flavobacterium caseinilyticum]TDD77021.1 acyltransferase [Flavobacterium caseinilyticum]
MSERIKYYDILRGIAIIAVILIHTLNVEVNNVISWTAILIRQLINFAVPLFIALSGYFMADKVFNTQHTHKMFLEKQLVRVYLPYLIWSLPYMFLGLYFHADTILISLFKLITFQTSGIFYYVLLIIQFYVFLPLLKKMANTKGLIIASLLSFTSCLVLIFLKLFLEIEVPLIIYAGNLVTWLMFFILGMYLKNNKMNINNTALLILIILSLILEMIVTKIHYDLLNNMNEAITAVKLSSFIYSGMIITLLLRKKDVYIENFKFLESLGQVSYAIYLNHLLILLFVNNFVKEASLTNQLLIFLFTVGVSYLICIMIKSINKNIAHKYLGI